MKKKNKQWQINICQLFCQSNLPSKILMQQNLTRKKLSHTDNRPWNVLLKMRESLNAAPQSFFFIIVCDCMKKALQNSKQYCQMKNFIHLISVGDNCSDKRSWVTEFELPKSVSTVVQYATLSAVSSDGSKTDWRRVGAGEGIWNRAGRRPERHGGGVVYLITGQFQHNTCLSSHLSALSLMYCMCLYTGNMLMPLKVLQPKQWGTFLSFHNIFFNYYK